MWHGDPESPARSTLDFFVEKRVFRKYRPKWRKNQQSRDEKTFGKFNDEQVLPEIFSSTPLRFEDTPPENVEKVQDIVNYEYFCR